MMLNQRLSNYFDDDRQINLIALQSAVFGLILAFLYVLLHFNELIIVITGLLMNSVMLAYNSSFYISSQRIKYGLFTSITSGIAYAVGCFTGENLLLSTMGIMLILPWVLFSNQSHGLIAGLFLYTFEGFILGTGMPTQSLNQLMSYSLAYTLGGLLIVLSGLVRLWLFAYLQLDKNTKVLQNTAYFEINQRTLIYNLIMLTVVVACNFISLNYHLVNGYWLPLTAFLIIKSDYNLAIARITFRVIGTLIGGGIALMCCMYIHNPLVYALLIFPAFYLTVIAISRHYGSFTALITISVMFIIALMGDNAVYKVEHRVIYTLAAVALVMLCLYLLKFILNKANLSHINCSS